MDNSYQTMEKHFWKNILTSPRGEEVSLWKAVFLADLDIS